MKLRHLTVVRPPASTPCARVGPSASTGRATTPRPRDGALLAAVLGIPGRYRELLATHGPLDEIDDLLRTPSGDPPWSALERIAHVADSLHTSARHVVAVLAGDDRARHAPLHVDAPRAGIRSTPTRAVLASLQAAAVDLARAASQDPAQGAAWAFEPRLRDRYVEVLLEGALAHAEHHLADVDALLAAAAAPASGAH